MKIKKIGHCCMVIEAIQGVRVLTDPGAPDYSGNPTGEENISVVLITHEHSDHLHVESLKGVLSKNPNAIVITNSVVGKILEEASITYIKVEDGETYDFNGVHIEGFGEKHAQIYDDFGQVQNTGYMINGFCFPGDSFSEPKGKVDILAFPVYGPWMKIKDTLDYVKKINPRVAFAVHDAPVKEFAKFLFTIPQHFLTNWGITFKKLEIGKEEEI